MPVAARRVSRPPISSALPSGWRSRSSRRSARCTRTRARRSARARCARRPATRRCRARRPAACRSGPASPAMTRACWLVAKARTRAHGPPRSYSAVNASLGGAAEVGPLLDRRADRLEADRVAHARAGVVEREARRRADHVEAELGRAAALGHQVGIVALQHRADPEAADQLVEVRRAQAGPEGGPQRGRGRGVVAQRQAGRERGRRRAGPAPRCGSSRSARPGSPPGARPRCRCTARPSSRCVPATSLCTTLAAVSWSLRPVTSRRSATSARPPPPSGRSQRARSPASEVGTCWV